MSLPPDFSSVPTGPPTAPEGWVHGHGVQGVTSPHHRAPVSPGFDPTSAPPTEGPLPKWGLIDIFLGLLFIIAAVIVATGLGLAVGGLDTMDDLVDGDLSGADAIIFLALTTIGQSGAMGLWPVIVSRWKGRNIRLDFGWRFEKIDLAYGVGVGVAMLFLAALVSFGVSALVGLDPGADESSNTQIISDAADGPAFIIILVAAVVLAPIVEELFFRGLCLRAIERRFGTKVGVIGSTLLFTLPHFTNPSLAGTTVLFAAIGTVGLVLAILTVKTGRLGGAVIAHAVFNAAGVAATLAAA